MYTIKTLTEKVAQKVSRSKFRVEESIYLPDYFRVLPTFRMTKREGREKLAEVFSLRTKEKLLKMFPGNGNMIHHSCAHVRKEN